MKTTLRYTHGLIIFAVWAMCSNVMAQTFVGTFAAVQGDVKILHPAGTNDTGPFASYEGQKYTYEAAKIGKKIKSGEIVQSGTDGKAKITYPNGDHFIVGNGTSMIMPTIAEKADGDKPRSALKLFYGRVRALVSKTGPRNNMEVKTPSAVAGVRGTDFFTRFNPAEGVDITVLRGEVAVHNNEKPANVVQVKTGYSGRIAPKSADAPNVIEASKQDLVVLQSEATVKKPDEKEVAALPEPSRKELQKLEEQSKQATLNDIKASAPELYESIQKMKPSSTDDINTAVVAKLYQLAPTDKKKKPTKEEIEGMGSDVYEKYFKKPGQ